MTEEERIQAQKELVGLLNAARLVHPEWETIDLLDILIRFLIYEIDRRMREKLLKST